MYLTFSRSVLPYCRLVVSCKKASLLYCIYSKYAKLHVLINNSKHAQIPREWSSIHLHSLGTRLASNILLLSFCPTGSWKPDCIQISWSCCCQDLTATSWRVWFWSHLQPRRSPLHSNCLYPVHHISDHHASFVYQPLGELLQSLV